MGGNTVKEKKTYYVYQHILGTDAFRISELTVYGDECLDTVDVNVSYHDEWTFFMYSESNEKMDDFMQGISDILAADHAAVDRLAVSALGRFRTFENAWKKYEASKPARLKLRGMDVHHDVPLNFSMNPDDAISQPYSAEAESWFTKRFLRCE